ncbi:MAG: glycosyltransferase family 4 protein [Candidatus Falkowbacteria bacterium]|nr:MAG: glycosyltransferase family 4 protein [Candidatus Falkowbacteria bacterium]
MKTLLLTLEFPPFNGGVANYYSNLLKYWPKEEKLEVIHNNQGALLKKGVFAWRGVIGLILGRQKDTSFDYLLVGHILPLGTAAYLASRIKPFKYGIVLHGLDFSNSLASPHKRLLTRLILGRADKIICANSRVAQLVINFNPKLEPKVKVVNPGVEPLVLPDNSEKVQSLRAYYRLDETFTLLTVGRLTLRKGVDAVIKSFSDIEIQALRPKYFIIGSGEQEEYLQDLAKNSPLADRIIFLGELSEADKWDWLRACDTFIMPAREIGGDFEGFGIVYLEANLAGKPVIAGNSGGVKDAVLHLVNGLLVNPDNQPEIKEAIIKLAKDKNLRQELGAKGKSRAQTEFNWDAQAKKLCQFIK